MALVSSLAFSGTALAHHGGESNASACGQVLTGDLTLTHDVGPCAPAASPDPGAALRVDSKSGITLDLGGFTVYGCDDPMAACNTAGVPPSAATVRGEGPGIVVNDSTNVTVKNGTVRDFDSGVVIHGGSVNTLTGLAVTNNVGTALTSSSYGEGIGIYRSDGNTVDKNTVQGNGPFAGIGLYNFTPDGTNLPNPGDSTDGNKIGNAGTAISRATCPSGGGNVVTDNFVDPNGTTYQDDGIRLEPGVKSNYVDCNNVSGSSLDGIAVFAGAWDNKVRYNKVTANGNQPLLTQRKGDGIRVFLRAERTLVEDNEVCGNHGSGISVDSTATYPATTPVDQRSTIQDNESGSGESCVRNAVGPDLPTRPAYDLLEGGHTLATESCRHIWLGNTPSTPAFAFPTCTDTN